jgi:hypothetical protein
VTVTPYKGAECHDEMLSTDGQRAESLSTDQLEALENAPWRSPSVSGSWGIQRIAVIRPSPPSSPASLFRPQVSN